MSISFYLKTTSVYLRYRQMKDGKRADLKYFPGITVDRDNWLQKKQRVRENSNEDIETNKKLVKIKKVVESIVDNFDIFALDNKKFEKIIEDSLKNRKKPVRTSFFAYCEQFFQEKKDESGYDRTKNIQTTIRKLREFSPKLAFEEVTDQFYREFVKHLRDKQYAENYVSKQITNLRRIMTQATKDKINTCLDFREFKRKNEEVYNVYLSEQEVENIYNLQLVFTGDFKEDYKRYINDEVPDWSDKQFSQALRLRVKAMDRARKIFVIGCWTGLRCENYLNIDPAIQVDPSGKFLQAIANKNGPRLLIPLHRIVSEIIADGWPETISGNKLNDHVKTLGRLAGIKEKVMFARTEGGTRITHVKMKYEMITSHTARRSFATNLFMRDVPAHVIRAVTGHKSEREFLKYIKAAPEQISRKLADYDVWGQTKPIPIE
jgi:Phage integrase SAM-like domain/Phage integrase family